MKKTAAIFLFTIIAWQLPAQQRIIAECTLTYSIAAPDASMDAASAFKASKKTVYIKGNDCRTDLVSAAFCQTMFYDKTTGNATILREFGTNKFMTKLDNAKWISENKKFEGLTINYAEEHKTIAGYDCKKATLQLKDGNSYVLYYTSAIVPSVKEFEYQFKDIPGLVLSYEAIGEKGDKVKYTATRVNLSPVPNSIFIIPTSGYRIL
ncbi:hypothetical protein [Parasediminibacterium sp. JCM 36343]|uniref:hypothetical protein n=1 Tax=Parasediminibacterium sp. JCM 36343 TaxID=3374279 RepID=UPI00397A18BD